ncbi:hypothetical protein A2618_02870 [Candidatus Collierbacteria bacterium RIFOXYD1_FULL_46_26]|uniref:tRNA-dihydrouridine synthase n=1 Tax=Candidatus Collierbacteria bacterium RIFOXYD1_FULL_46_26 TaxID=1817732 RepID=A0A1F5G0B7_9BACT|nr:MAG: hypothetical protein A2618_02870 [Candidatus Collierbacteria bacterium RIFOXYD1_FULL_46_26]
MFWQDLFGRGLPVVGLSPMDGVTDAAFRYMVAKYGKPDVIFTEFVSVDALHFTQGERRERLLQTFRFDPGERPVVAQVFGRTPELFAEAAELIEDMGFDGIDINMGCPAKKVSEQGAGAGLIRTPKLAQEIIRVTKANTSLPVSVKTRIGVTDKTEMEEWMETLMEVAPAVVSLHGRTLRQLYTGEADWETIARAGEIVHHHGGYILGNGDVKKIKDVRRKTLEYGVDGVLIGRGAEGNPGIFAGIKDPTKEQRLAWAVEHARKFEEIFQNLGVNYFMPVRKHLAWYAHGFPGAGELRQNLMMTNSAEEVAEVIARVV